VKRRLECDGPKDLTWIDHNTTFKAEPVTQDALFKASKPVQLSFAAFEDDICLAYTRKNLLRGGPIEIACNMIEHHGASISNAASGLDLLRKAMLSLSVTFFGSQHRQNRITNKGYHQYGEVLGQLNSHLANPELQKTNETLLTALTCMLLEIFLPTGPKNFFKHQRGLDAIAMLRGPPTESEGVTATIFRGLRILSIVGSLAESRPSLYANEEWKQALPVPASEADMLQHHVFTVLADCTRLITQRDALFASGAPPGSYEPLLAEVDKALSDLEELHPLWEALNEHQMAEITEQSDLAKAIGVANSVSAFAYMLYHGAYMCIIQIKDSLAPSPMNTVLRNVAAMTIAKCLELKEHEQREGAAQSTTIAFVATKVAWQALGGLNSPEGLRLANSVMSATNTVFRSPHPPPDETLFAQFMVRVPIAPSNRSVHAIGSYALPINDDVKPTPPTESKFSIGTTERRKCLVQFD
jgi:hypothetical protein